MELDPGDGARLAAAVMAAAVHDLLASDAQARRSALRFMASPRSSLAWMASSLGLDFEAVQERAFARLAEVVGEGEARRRWKLVQRRR